jgi:opacity protein-like surface antigen
MKKLIVPALTFVSLAASAAETASTGHNVGIYGGANFGTVSATGITVDSMTGLVLGVRTFMPLAPTFEFAPGLQFAQRGYGFNIGVVEVDAKISYLELPLLFRAVFPTDSMVPFITAGPNVGVKLGTSCAISSGTCTVTSDSIKSVNFGLDLGAGADFGLASGNMLGFEVRYHFGLSKISDAAAAPKNRGWMLLAAFRF